MYRGLSAESPKARRRDSIVALMLLSKSTTVSSGQSLLLITSRVDDLALTFKEPPQHLKHLFSEKNLVVRIGRVD
jgi:hypothetical protein